MLYREFLYVSLHSPPAPLLPTALLEARMSWSLEGKKGDANRNSPTSSFLPPLPPQLSSFLFPDLRLSSAELQPGGRETPAPLTPNLQGAPFCFVLTEANGDFLYG